MKCDQKTANWGRKNSVQANC